MKRWGAKGRHLIVQQSANKQRTRQTPGLLFSWAFLPDYPPGSRIDLQEGGGPAGGAEQRKPFRLCELPVHTISLSHVASLQLKDNLSGVAASQGFKTFLSCGRRK